MTLKNYQRVLNFLTVSIEQIDREFWTNWQGFLKFPKIEFFAKFCSKLVRFYIKILQIVQFLLILYIFSNVPLKPNNLHKPHLQKPTRESIMSIYIHKLLKLPRLDPNLWSLKTLAMSLFILTRFCNKSSLSTNNTAYFRHIF